MIRTFRSVSFMCSAISCRVRLPAELALELGGGCFQSAIMATMYAGMCTGWTVLITPA